MAKVLDDTFDAPHKDLRRARAAALSIIPTSTGTARAVGLLLPELAGALDGIALRVPMEDGSLTDLTIVLNREATAEEINAAFAAAADGPLNGFLRVSTAPIVSRDVIGDRCSVIMLSGEYDYLTTPEDGRRTAEAIRGAEFIEMKEIGHFPMSENHPRFAQYLGQALERIEKRTGS